MTLPVAADGVGDRMQAAFDEWRGDVATMGQLGTGTRVDGTWQVTAGATAAELASVSKSITAVCALQLVEEGVLDWSDTLPDRLGKGPDVTAAQLVTHSSGLTLDVTQAAMPGWLDDADTAHKSAAILDVLVDADGIAGAPNRYAYNNVNYALLALMIEAATGQGFVEACWPRLGLTLDIRASARSGAFGPWGGLEATPAGYLGFLHRHFGPGSLIGTDPFAYPHVEIGGGAYYGLGMVFRPFRGSYNFWHFGALCFPNRLETGSFAVIWEGRHSALALYDACVDWDSMSALDAALAGAVYGAGP
ncbi:serine hydrolase domain-containing protein [Tateyamaria sp. SN6-1]|uniref:serine hydrolase domain-containing protein n=1 Tax=Tateyamaria sp. SN6-1 TaxID=3092148 RepID=UPI0039F5991F